MSHRMTNYIDYQAESSLSFQVWLNTARPGSLFLTNEGQLYLMTYFDHHRITEPVATALIHKDRMIRERVLRNQTVIRGLFGYSAIATVVMGVLIYFCL